MNKKLLQTSVPCLPGLLKAPRGHCDWQDFGVGRRVDNAHTSLERRAPVSWPCVIEGQLHGEQCTGRACGLAGGRMFKDFKWPSQSISTRQEAEVHYAKERKLNIPRARIFPAKARHPVAISIRSTSATSTLKSILMSCWSPSHFRQATLVSIMHGNVIFIRHVWKEKSPQSEVTKPTELYLLAILEFLETQCRVFSICPVIERNCVNYSQGPYTWGSVTQI